MRVLLVFAVLVIPLKRVIEMFPDRWRDYKFCLKKKNTNRTAYLLTLLLKYCRKGGLLPRPERGLLSNTLKWIIQRDSLLTKQETLLGKGAWTENRRLKEPRRTTLPHGSWSRVLWWWDYFPGCLWPIISDTGSFLVTHASLCQDGFQQEGFWEVGRIDGLVSPHSFWPFPNSSDWR